MSNEQMLNETASQLKEFLLSKNVIGAPIDLGDKILLPISRFGFGFGAAGSNRKDGGGEGAGGGGGIEPVALVIIHKDIKGPEGVQVMSLKKDSALAQVISAVSESLAPQVIDALKTISQNKAPATKEKKEDF